MSVTIKDVAREAGVSVASVSRALNGHENVTAETRKNINAVATRLRYMPHGAARSLITRRTQTIGALLPDLHGEFFSELIRGMDRAARSRGLHLLVSSSHGDAAEAAAALRAMQGRVDGLLMMSPHVDAGFLDSNLPAALPTVLMNTPIADSKHASLTTDNYGGAVAVVRHLVELGYRDIAMLAGPENNHDAEERQRGYCEALAKYLPGVQPCIVPGDFSEESGYRAARKLCDSGTLPQAIFAANDMMAIGCLFALNEAGRNVPRDVALIGFDDIPIARYVTPPLTTVRIRIADLGEQALDRLIAAIEDPDADEPFAQTLACELVVRESCRRQRVETREDSS